MNNDNDDNLENLDNLYFLFKDFSNSPKSKDNFEPKINKPNWSDGTDWQKFFTQFNESNPPISLREKLQKKKAEPAFDTVKLERRLISLLDTIEELLGYLENRRHNNTSDSF